MHDAEITDIEKTELQYDYKEKNPLRNCLTLHINSSDALYARVKTIHFYNYRIISGDIHKAPYWVCDKLEKENSKYKLTITLADIKKEYHTVILFDTVKTE